MSEWAIAILGGGIGGAIGSAVGFGAAYMLRRAILVKVLAAYMGAGKALSRMKAEEAQKRFLSLGYGKKKKRAVVPEETEQSESFRMDAKRNAENILRRRERRKQEERLKREGQTPT